jgi:O-antigen ligase
MNFLAVLTIAFTGVGQPFYMGLGRFSLLFATVLGLLALALTSTAGAAQTCGSRLLADWRDGRIDRTYPVPCYRQALANLPEDVQVYSTAHSDITRALQARLAAQSVKSTSTGHDESGVSPLLVVAITAAILVAAGSVAAVVR